MDGASFTKANEGCRLQSYQDTLGFWTIGYGCLLGRDPSFANVTWTQEKADSEFAVRYGRAISGAISDVGMVCWGSIGNPRKGALADLAYQMGQQGLAAFKLTIAAILNGDWMTAASELLASHYAAQTPNRAKIVAKILLTGLWPDGTST